MHELSLLNTEVSLDVIIANAKEELHKLGTAKESIAADLETPSQEMNLPDLLQDIDSSTDVNDLLYDRKSQPSVNVPLNNVDALHNSMDAAMLNEENSVMCENYCLGEGETCESCVIDRCRACFVLRYFPIMNFARIRALLTSTSKCRWRTWIAYISTLRCKFLFFLVYSVSALSHLNRHIEISDAHLKNAKIK